MPAGQVFPELLVLLRWVIEKLVDGLVIDVFLFGRTPSVISFLSLPEICWGTSPASASPGQSLEESGSGAADISGGSYASVLQQLGGP